MDVVSEKAPAFLTWWQGGDRYSDNIAPDGVELKLEFEKNSLYATPIWNQLYGGIKLCELDFSSFFNNDNPINLEIGMGNGEFLCGRALENNSENWVGVEVFKKIFKKAASRVVRLKVENARVVQFDAALILRLFKDGALNSVFVNFPDPWPKTNHKRRRLLKVPFLELIAAKLKHGGALNIVTDHEDYAMEIKENLACVSSLKSIYEEDHIYGMIDYFPTKYYKKFALNSGAYFFKYEKV